MPKYLIKALVPRLQWNWREIKPHLLPIACVVVAFMAFYLLARAFPPGWLTYTLNAIAGVILGVTALARVNDIPHTDIAPRWQVRRAGLIAVGTGSFAIIVYPWVMPEVPLMFPAWRTVLLHWGMVATWITTPLMPPWHHYVSGEFRKLRVEIPQDVVLEVTRSTTQAGGTMFTDNSTPPEHAPDEEIR